METKSFINSMARTVIAQISQSKVWQIFSIFMLAWLSMAFQANAQSYSEIDIAGMNPTIISPDVILNAGESAEFYIHIGTSTKPVENVVGFKLNIELSPNARLESTINPQVNGWLGFNTKLTESTLPQHPEKFKLEYAKTLANTGYGQILKIKIFCTTNQTHASRLVRSVGGLMIIDNLDARMGQFSANAIESQKVYPNPGNGQFKISGNLENIQEMNICALNGTVLEHFAPSNAFDISQLPSGCYLLEIKSLEGNSSFQKLIKN